MVINMMSEIEYARGYINKNQRRMVPLIQTDGSRIGTSEEGMRFLRSLKRTQISVVGLWSRKKSGRKSLLYSLGVSGDISTKQSKHEHYASTLVWIWNDVINQTSYNGEERDVILVSVDDFSQKSVNKISIEKVLSMTLLLCSHFIYNSEDNKEEECIQDFGYLGNSPSYFSVNDRETSTVEDYSSHFPKFSWVVRGSDIKSNFEERMSSRIESHSSHSEYSSSVSSFRQLFTSKECIHLGKAKRHGSDHPEGGYELDESFSGFGSSFFSRLDVKAFYGKKLTGLLIVEIIEMFINDYNNEKKPKIYEFTERVTYTEIVETIWTSHRREIEHLYNEECSIDITESQAFEAIINSETYRLHKHSFECRDEEFHSLLKRRIAVEIHEINLECRKKSSEKFRFGLLKDYKVIEESIEFSSEEAFIKYHEHMTSFMRRYEFSDSSWKAKIFLEFCVEKISAMVRMLIEFVSKRNIGYETEQNKNNSYFTLEVDTYRAKVQEFTRIINSVEIMRKENSEYMKTVIQSITVTTENDKRNKDRSTVEKECTSCKYLKDKTIELIERNKRIKTKYEEKISKLIADHKVEINNIISKTSIETDKIRIEFEKMYEKKKSKVKEIIDENEIRIQELIRIEADLRAELTITKEEYLRVKSVLEKEIYDVSIKCESFTISIENLLKELSRLKDLIKVSDTECEKLRVKVREYKEIFDDQKRIIAEKQDEIISLTFLNQTLIQKINIERLKCEQFESRDAQSQIEIKNFRLEIDLLRTKTSARILEFEIIIKSKNEEIRDLERRLDIIVTEKEKERTELINSHTLVINNVNKTYTERISKLKIELDEVRVDTTDYEATIEKLKEKIIQLNESKKIEIRQLIERNSKYIEKESSYFSQIEAINNSIEQYKIVEKKLKEEVSILKQKLEVEQKNSFSAKVSVEEYSKIIKAREEEFRRINEKYNETTIEFRKMRIKYDTQIEILEAEKFKVEKLLSKENRDAASESTRIRQLESEKSDLEIRLANLSERNLKLEYQITQEEHMDTERINQITELKSRTLILSDEVERYKLEVSRLKQEIELKGQENEEITRKKTKKSSKKRSKKRSDISVEESSESMIIITEEKREEKKEEISY